MVLTSTDLMACMLGFVLESTWPCLSVWNHPRSTASCREPLSQYSSSSQVSNSCSSSSASSAPSRQYDCNTSALQEVRLLTFSSGAGEGGAGGGGGGGGGLASGNMLYTIVKRNGLVTLSVKTKYRKQQRAAKEGGGGGGEGVLDRSVLIIGNRMQTQIFQSQVRRGALCFRTHALVLISQSLVALNCVLQESICFTVSRQHQTALCKLG